MRRKSGKEGFIVIVALGIFALLMFFGLMVQQTVVQTYANVQDTRNYYSSVHLADSLISYLRAEMQNHEAGFSTGKLSCNYGAAVAAVAAAGGADNPAICGEGEPIGNIVKDIVARSNSVVVNFEVKGRPTVAEKISTAQCNTFRDGCYVTPLGDGTAGSSRCSYYEPGFLNNPVPGGNSSQTVDLTVIGVPRIDNLEYACNWNKLTFGSNLGDRVAVPLYYDGAASLEDGEQIVNPYQSGATKFVLRMRTPCLPCGVEDPNTRQIPAGTRRCTSGVDEMYCEDRYRYQLNLADGDDMVVQWELAGRCVVNNKEQACGLVGYPKVESGLYESVIKRALNPQNPALIDLEKKGQITHLSGIVHDTIMNTLPSFTKPVFTLFLNHALTSDLGANIPYLEYQILTDKPIGNSRLKMTADIKIDDVGYTQTFYKELTKPLIDFAIQN